MRRKAGVKTALVCAAVLGAAGTAALGQNTGPTTTASQPAGSQTSPTQTVAAQASPNRDVPGVAPATFLNTPPRPAPPVIVAPAPGASPVEQGRYLAVLGDCAACHTRAGGAPFTGGYPLHTPFGVIYSSNLTPDRTTGIGGWTDQQFYDAMHSGHRADGANLYPAFPYPYFTHMSRAETDALHAYFNAMPAVNYTPPANGVIFPFNVRLLLKVWNWLNFKPDETGEAARWSRGAYIVNGPGHCGACHTPKTLTYGDDRSKALQGGLIDNWAASDLTEDAEGGLRSWSQADIVEFLKTGRNARSNASGSMGDVIRVSTSHMADSDLQAIATYLKSLPAPKAATAAPAADAATMAAGQAIYVDACSACHKVDGIGVPRFFPPLAGNANVSAANPTTILHFILTGTQSQATDARPTAPSMPAYAWKLNDQEIAAVATYIRQSWGAKAAPVTAGQVNSLRAKVAAHPVVKPSSKV